MKRLKIITILLIFLLTGGLLFAGSALADKTLSVGSASGSVDAVVSLPITVDDPTGVGGIAFTLSYDPDIFEFQGLEKNVKDISDASEYAVPGADPVQYDGYTQETVANTLFYQVNNDAIGGKVLVAAASAQALTDANLYQVKFLIKGGQGDYPIAISQTIVQNADAGYADPTSLPVLVGMPADQPDSEGYYPTPVFTTQLVDGKITVTAAYARGDVNLDGNITPQDAVDSFWLSFKTVWTDLELLTADYNEDGQITPQDAVDIFWASF